MPDTEKISMIGSNRKKILLLGIEPKSLFYEAFLATTFDRNWSSQLQLHLQFTCPRDLFLQFSSTGILIVAFSAHSSLKQVNALATQVFWIELVISLSGKALTKVKQAGNLGEVFFFLKEHLNFN